MPCAFGVAGRVGVAGGGARRTRDRGPGPRRRGDHADAPTRLPAGRSASLPTTSGSSDRSSRSSPGSPRSRSCPPGPSRPTSSRGGPTACSSRTAPATRRRSAISSKRCGGPRRGPRLRDLPRPPAARRGARGGHLQAPLRPPRRQPSGAATRDRRRRGDLPEPRLRRRRPGAARGREITHVNLNDGVIEGLAAPSLPAFSVQYHPEAGPGPHDARYLFDEFAGRWTGKRRALMARRDDLSLDPRHRLGADRHRPGLRVRLLGDPGLPGARRGGVPGDPRQLQPGDDHDRPRASPHRTYIEPLDHDVLAAIIERERPDAVLPTMGGQTALNLAMALTSSGVLEAFGVELIGARAEAIRTAEDRELFKSAMTEIGLEVPDSGSPTSSTRRSPSASGSATRPWSARASSSAGRGPGSRRTDAELVDLAPAASPPARSGRSSSSARSRAGRSTSSR